MVSAGSLYLQGCWFKSSLLNKICDTRITVIIQYCRYWDERSIRSYRSNIQTCISVGQRASLIPKRSLVRVQASLQWVRGETGYHFAFARRHFRIVLGRIHQIQAIGPTVRMLDCLSCGEGSTPSQPAQGNVTQLVQSATLTKLKSGVQISPFPQSSSNPIGRGN